MRDKVSGAIAIPRQAGDVPQPCRTVRKWFSKNQKIHIHQNFTAIFSRFPSDFHTNLQGYTYLSVSFNK